MNSCYKTSNNKHFKCPPMVSDGRHFTDYRPNCHINNLLRVNNNISNSYEYRMFLTNNANNLMDLNRTYACQKNCCGPCKEPYHEGTMLGEASTKSCTKNSCSTEYHNKGIGQGRKYSDSNCNWPNSPPYGQLSNCCASNNNLFNYYNFATTKAQGELTVRNTMPSGAGYLQGGDPVAYNL